MFNTNCLISLEPRNCLMQICEIKSLLRSRVVLRCKIRYSYSHLNGRSLLEMEYRTRIDISFDGNFNRRCVN